MGAGGLSAELVAPVANMLEAALAAGAGDECRAERLGQDQERAPGAAGGRLRAPVEPGAGARARRVDRPPVRARRRGGPPRLERRADARDRRRPRPLRPGRLGVGATACTGPTATA